MPARSGVAPSVVRSLIGFPPLAWLAKLVTRLAPLSVRDTMCPDGTDKTGHTWPCLAERQRIFSGGLVSGATEEDGLHQPTASVPSGVSEERILGLAHL